MNPDFSIKSQPITTIDNSKIMSSSTRIGDALRLGNVGNSELTCNNKVNDLKQTRDNELSLLAKKYGISKEDIFNYIKKAFGYTAEMLYSLDETTYNLLKNRTLPVVFNFVKSLPKSNKNLTLQQKLDINAEKFSKMLQNGNTIEEATNFYENFNDNGLFQIIKIQFPNELKQYNSAKDVPSSVLENCITKFFVHYKQYECTKNSKNIGKSLTIFKNLLSKTSGEDYKIIYNAFLKVATKEDEKLAGLVSLIDSFKNNKSAFEKFVNEDLKNICLEKGLEYEKVKPIINKIAEIAKVNGIDSIEFMENLLNLLTPEKIYGDLKQKDEKDLTEYQKEFINQYETYKTIEDKKNNGIALSHDEQAILENFIKKKNAVKEGIVAAITAHNQDNADEILKIAEQKYGMSVDNILEKLIELGKEFENVNIDNDLLDKLTDGKFSEALSEYEAKSSEKVSDTDSNAAQGFGFSQSPIENIPFDANVKLQNLYNQSKVDATFKIINSKSKEVSNASEKHIKNWSVVTSEELRKHLSKNNISFGDVLDNYEDLPSSTQLFVDDMISSMSKGMQTYFLNGIKGKNHVIVNIVKKISADPEKLNLALDYASKKELERIEETRYSV